MCPQRSYAPSRERFIDISAAPARLSVRDGCLVVEPKEGEPVRIPAAELCAVVIAHPQASASLPALAMLMASNVPVVVCGPDMQPTGMLLPISGNTLSSQRMLAQAAASVPLRKRLWASVVRAKVLAQATALEGLRPADTPPDAGLRSLAGRVRSGDPDNVEAQAAARYWPLVFGDSAFRRRFDAEDQNRLLNYGYAVLRAAIGRAICAAGLHPTLGLHHRHRENAYCLCDDLMEPYRPLVDAEVAKIAGEHGPDAPLNPPTKRRLAELLSLRLRVDRSSPDERPVGECMFATASSVARAMLARSRERSSDQRACDDSAAKPMASGSSVTRPSDEVDYPWGLLSW